MNVITPFLGAKSTLSSACQVTSAFEEFQSFIAVLKKADY
jgi:hypothetical protein